MNKMLRFSPEALTAQEQKKVLIGSVIPRPIALVSTLSDSGVINVAPFSYFNIVTYDPPILSIAVQRAADGALKDTTRNLFDNHEAVVQVVDTDNVEMANMTSATLDPDESELDIAQFTRVDSQAVQVPGLNEAKVRFETTLHDSMIIYNDGQMPSADVVLLKVKYYHIDETIYHQGRIDPSELNAVSRLAGHDYAEIGRLFAIERPE